MNEHAAREVQTVAHKLSDERAILESVRDSADRSDPAGRQLSLAITAIEEAELRIARATGAA